MVLISTQPPHAEPQPNSLKDTTSHVNNEHPLSSAVPIEDSRQGSFDKVAKVRISNSTMPSTVDLSKNKEVLNENSGRDSPASMRVRFRDGNNALLHQSQTSLNPTPNGQQKVLNASPSKPDESPVVSILKHSGPPTNNKTTPNTLSRPAVSVFERLSKTETVAFMNQKILTQQFGKGQTRRMKRSTSAPPSLRSKNTFVQSKQPPRSPAKNRKSISPDHKKQFLTEKIAHLASTSFDLFERLAEKHTALSKSRLRERSEIKNNTKNNTSKSQTRGRPLGRRHTLGRARSFDRLNSRAHPVEKKKKTKSKRAKQILDDSFDLESTGPPMEIEFSRRTKILCSHKFNLEAGFEELDVLELGLNVSLCEYEVGAMSAKEFASEIMSALLWRDLPSAVKWEVKRPLERELAMPIGEIGYSIMTEAAGNTILNAGDLSEDEEEESYTASATGNVTFLPDREIQVENYSCVHTFENLD